ncbi:hypothetical protein ACIBP6_44620 [Nonomuraea terrae]
MSSSPAPEPQPQQDKKPRKKIAVRRLDKIETTGWSQPSGGSSN